MTRRVQGPALWVCVGIIVAGCSAEPAPVPPSPTPPRASPSARPHPTRSGAAVETPVPPAPSPPPAVEEPTPAPSAVTAHTVAPGETLLGLAQAYGVPMAALQLANDLGAEMGLRAGQQLEIPAPERWQGASPFWVLTLVESGDTLIDVAAQYDLELADLRAANDMGTGDLLVVGQPLILPLDGPAEAVAQAALPPPTAVPPTPTAPPPSASPPPDTPGAPTPTTDTPATEPPPPPAEVAGWPGEVFRLINAERARHGLAPFVYDETLAQAARLHGADCQQRGSCGHTGSDGSSVRERVARAGYDAAGAAECIVYNSSPQGAVAWWLDEVPPNDAHRRTLLSTWVTEIGIAVVPTGWGNYYFIANFGRPGGG